MLISIIAAGIVGTLLAGAMINMNNRIRMS